VRGSGRDVFQMAVLRTLISSWTGKAVVGVVALALVGGVVVAPRLTSSAPAPTIRTAAVGRGNVTQTVAVSGSLNAFATYKMSFKVSGAKLADVPVKVGQSVAIGTVLGKLDTTDFENAVRQAAVNLTSAQARYDQTVAGATPEDVAIARNQVETAQKNYDLSTRSTQNDMAASQQSLDNAKRTLDQTKQSTANDLAAAQQTFDRIKTAYSSARSTFGSLSLRLKTDIASYQSAIATAKDATSNALSAAGDPGLSDVQTSLTSAVTSLANALTAANGPVQDAVTDLSRATDQLIAAANAFDGAVASSTESGTAVAQFQAAQSAYTLAAARLSSALDLPAAFVTSASTSVTTANNSLNTYYRASNSKFDDARAAVAPVVPLLEVDAQLAGGIKSEVGQAGVALGTMGDTIGGAYVTAQQSLVSMRTKADSSVATAEASVASAQQSFSSAQDKASSTLTSQQQAIQSASLSFQKTSASPKATDIAVAFASVQLSQLSLDKAKQDLDNATLRAPVDGVVAAVANGPGETPSNPFVTIAVVSSVILHGTVGEADIAKLRTGQVATVTVDAAGSGTRLTGKVTALDPVATISQGVPVYGVDVTIDLADANVRPGMSGTAAVIIASQQGVLTVPNLAVRTVNGQRTLQVVRNGAPEDAQVTFGISNETVTEVKSGLSEGEVVVIPQARPSTSTRPQQFGPGGPVRIGG
jgi:macrolide-specific efflux system membrane fusion protein